MGGSVDAAIAASDGDTGAAIDQAIRGVQEVSRERPGTATRPPSLQRKEPPTPSATPRAG